jgi:UDP-glucose 4-epimerase
VIVLVTGASGYLGRAVVPALTAAGHSVRPFAGDVLDRDAVAAAVERVDAVIHLAARTRVRESFSDPVGYFQVNVTGTVNLLASVPAGTRFMLASTASVYGTPERQPIAETCPLAPGNPYAASKAAAESALAWASSADRVVGTTLRIFNLAGAVDGHGDPDPTRILPRCLAAAAGQLSHVDINGPGTAIRDFVHITDAATAFVLALPASGGVYNIGAIPASVNDILAATARVTGHQVPVEHHPPHPGEAPDLRADTTLSYTEFGWFPRHTTLDPLIASQWQALQDNP